MCWFSIFNNKALMSERINDDDGDDDYDDDARMKVFKY